MDTTNQPSLLVIDDENGFRQMLSFALVGKGYGVTVACNGEEGVEMARHKSFDVIISDLTMPKMGGLEVLKAVKEIDSKIEVIIGTGYASLDTALQSMKQGAYDYITKPYNIDDLCRLVERALDKRQLNLRVDKLQELNRLKSEFLANMSHELRTPMNAIIGYTSLVLDGIYGEIPEESRQALKRVDTNAKNLLQLINNILDLSKLSAGRMPIYIENCDLRDIAQEVVDTLHVLADEKKLDLHVEAPKPIIVSTDKTKIKQALINLVGNGIKFTTQGGVTIVLDHLPNNEGVQIHVRDTGPGMNPEDIPLLFQEFKQLDASSTREHGGTGLGLSITKKIAELLGGKIHVESVVGQGSSFIMTFPLEKKAPSEAPGESANKVLLSIDDDPEVLNLLQDSLKGSGFKFVGAQSGEEGLALARKLKPSVITLDIMMPHMDGWSVLQLIKNDPGLSQIPVIILSIMENKELGFSLGVADYIVKPFERKALLEKLHYLEKKQSKTKKKSSPHIVLIADDDSSMVDIFSKAFENQDVAVQLVKSETEIFNAMKNNKPDILFLNLMMSQINGFEILKKIQKDSTLQNVSTVVVTSQNLSAQDMEYLQKRVEMIVQKESINLNDVLSTLKGKIAQIKEGVTPS